MCSIYQRECMAIEMKTSVRSLVEFLLRNGDIDNRTGNAPEDAMLEGSAAHRLLQKQAGPDYESEVSLSCKWEYKEPYNTLIESSQPVIAHDKSADIQGGSAHTSFSVIVGGRADGIYTGNLPDDPSSPRAPVIDEIKTTYRNLYKMTAPEPVHLAQAFCYAYMYCSENNLPFVYIRVTYYNLDNEDIHYFYERKSLSELTEWFTALMHEYQKWAEFALRWMDCRGKSIHELTFPYEYRKGQKELASDVYRTIVHERKLFLEAPTGTGKTISALFPSIKAMGENKAERIFYLTARTVTASVAEETIETLRSRGLKLKSVILTAKDKICVLDKPDCNPDECPRARGHYDRINKAVYDMLTHSDNMSRETIIEFATKHEVCPFEMSLDLSLFSDVVICDYNYVFDPHVYLRRFFGDSIGDAVRNNYIFLVDEAHNLVDRGREMYSARISEEELRSVSRAITAGSHAAQYITLADSIDDAADELKKLRAIMGNTLRVCSEEDISGFDESINNLYKFLSLLMDNERRAARRRKKKISRKRGELQERILNFYFEISHYLLISELLDDHYRIYTELSDGKFHIRLFCMDPGKNLKSCMDRGRSTILFSATLLPIQYYKKLLGGTDEDYEVYAHSVFDPEKRALLIANDVTSMYKRRGPEEYDRIAECIEGVISGRHGNYLVFLPSYAFMKEVADAFEYGHCDHKRIYTIRQTQNMGEPERADFLGRFETGSDEHSLVGFAVLGGIFSEGIDLKHDSLIGVIIVGTGIPQVCGEREMLRQYFDDTGVDGYDYAYCYPGMNKVLQAAGRVIRTEDDLGVVALLDERFTRMKYLRLFPREWANYQTISTDEAGHAVDNFWNEWL